MLLDYLPVYIFGLFLSAALVTAILVVSAEAGMSGGSEDNFQDLCFWILLAAMIGGRLLFFVMHPGVLSADPLAFFRFWEGGVVYYGGIAAAVPVVLIYINKTGLPLGKTADSLTPGLAVGHFFGWLGCFFSGICNKASPWLPWGWTSGESDLFTAENVGLHPISLYLACSQFLIFGFLVFFKERRKFDGQAFWIYLVRCGVSRCVIEILPAHNAAGIFFGPISAAHLVGAVSACVALAMLTILGHRSRKKRYLPQKDTEAH